jgi:hypothetical protein
LKAESCDEVEDEMYEIDKLFTVKAGIFWIPVVVTDWNTSKPAVFRSDISAPPIN